MTELELLQPTHSAHAIMRFAVVRERLLILLAAVGGATMFIAPTVHADRPNLRSVRTICPSGETPAPIHDGYSCGAAIATKPDDSCRPVGRTDGVYCLWTCGYPTKESAPRCYNFQGASVPCLDPNAFMCSAGTYGGNYVWAAGPDGSCHGDPGPENGIYAAPGPPSQAATFVPPRAPGEIYIVIDYKRTGHPDHPWERGAMSVRTSVAAGWGGWNHHGILAPPAATVRGVVLRLHHGATDSVPLLIATDGDITSGPSQGAPPAEWTDPAYQHVQWP
jgi:hypothetical protein